MADLNVLFLTRKGDGYVGAPQTQYGFEQAVAKLCACKFAGKGWNLHKEGEPMSETVERVMPDADWVIDRDNNLHNKKPRGRTYKVGHFISDLHAKHFYKTGNPVVYTDLLNKADYDSVFMRYQLLHGTNHRPDVIWDRLGCGKHWVPWSVDEEYYRPDDKTVDVAFIGRVNRTYPLRTLMWNGIYHVARGNKIIREQSPPGKTYERTVESLIDSHLVGDRYRDALAKTRIFMFGCSKYKYPLQRFFQASASGCLVMSNAPSMAKQLGFIGGETYADTHEENWESVLLFLLDNPDLVEKMAKNGRENTLKKHTHQKRAQQLLEILEQ